MPLFRKGVFWHTDHFKILRVMEYFYEGDCEKANHQDCRFDGGNTYNNSAFCRCGVYRKSVNGAKRRRHTAAYCGCGDLDSLSQVDYRTQVLYPYRNPGKAVQSDNGVSIYHLYDNRKSAGCGAGFKICVICCHTVFRIFAVILPCDGISDEYHRF